jgi:hypothetical protein
MFNGIINKVKDNFNSAEFSIAPNKKIKTVCREFKDSFGVTLVVYKGNIIAEGDLTINQLNKKTSKEVNKGAKDLKIVGAMKVEDVENSMNEIFGIKVQIKDKNGKHLVPNEISIGAAARGEY